MVHPGDGPTSALKHRNPFSRLRDERRRVKVERGADTWSLVGVSVVAGLSFQISGLVWRRGEGQGGCCCSSRVAPTTTTMFLWSMSFFTIDSSINNHYSQLDMKWVDPAGPLIARSIGDHKMAVSPPEGSISMKTVTLTESQHIMILRGQQVQ